MKPFEVFTGNLQLDEKEVKGQKKQYVKGLITTDDKDLVNDIVTQKCMDSMVSQLKDRTMKLDFEHETFSGKTEQEMEINKTKIPLGKRVDWQRKPNGIEVEWELNPTWKQVNSKGEIITKYEDIVYNIKNGFYDGFSIAYYPTQTDTKNIKGENVRLLDDVNLLNVALTGNPVNQKASLTEIMAKSRDFIEKQEGKGQVLDEVMEKVSMGKELNNKEEKLLKNALDAAKDDDLESQMGEKIMSKISQGQELTYREERLLSALLDVGHEETQEQKSHSNLNETEHSSDEKLNKQEGKMAEENSEKPQEQTEQPKETESQEASKEVQEKPEEKSDKVAEVKSELKSLKDSQESLKKEIEEVKNLIKTPQRKSVQEGKSEQKEEETKNSDEPKRPLDLIR